MTTFNFFRFSALAAAGFLTHAAWADGFRNPPDTAAALGKAGNNMVWCDDATAVFNNPANLVDVPSRQVQLSGMLGYSHADYRGALGATKTVAPWGVLPAFDMAWPLHETDLALGLGSHVPYGRQTKWDSDGPIPLSSQMSVADISPELAWRISDSVSVGAGLDVYYGHLGFKSAPMPNSTVKADADGYAFGGNAGITWRMTPDQRLALTYRAPFDLTFRGKMKTDGIPPPVAVPESDLDSSFSFPTIVALGYGIRLTEKVRVETKVEWLEFSRNRTMCVNAYENAPLATALNLANAPQNWSDTWTFGIGPEWDFIKNWTLRAGYLYLQSPIPDSTFSPMAMDVDQSVASAGLGYKYGRHAVDLAYAIGIFDKRHAGVNRQDTYDFQGHLAALTYTYSF
mgnify:CR=1 FL=1